MINSKFAINILFGYILTASLFTLSASAEELNPYADIDKEPTSSLETKNMGLYLLSRVVDITTGKPLSNVEITSSTSKTLTDANGEFFIPVSNDDYIFLKLEKYKETSIRVSSIKGKIKLELIPQYLPLIPNLSALVSYRNVGLSENYKDVIASGRINDSFGIDVSGKFNSFFAGLDYENMGGLLNRSQTKETSGLSNNNVSLKLGYDFNVIKDTLDIVPGLKGTLSLNSIMIKTVNEDENRDSDFLDYSSQRIGAGLDIEVAARPIRYTPIVLGGFVSYYPLVSVSQDPGGTLPNNLNGFDFGVSARYDIANIFLKGKYFSKSLFMNNYNSSVSGFSVGVGYAF